MDVRSQESISAMVEAALSAFGSLDMAANFARITGAGTLVADTIEEHVPAIVEINLLGVWHSKAEELGAMLRTGTMGLIINAASAMALWAARRSAAYAMAKAAVVHNSQSYLMALSAGALAASSVPFILE